VTLAVGTAVSGALFDATRTAEADIPHYRQVELAAGELLLNVARRYNTTVEVLRMANQLREDVDAATGGEIIVVPQGVQRLDPPRSFQTYVAVDGDSLTILSIKFDVPIDVLQMDNPILAQRGINPGDIVFIAELLR
jgi:LysM repeat protein